MKNTKKILAVGVGGALLLGGFANTLVNITPVAYAEKVDGVCQVETKTGTVDFNIKGEVNTVRKPVDLLAILDTSSSMVENFGRSLDSATALVNSLGDNDTVVFGHYGLNTANSYNANNGSVLANAGALSERMTKAEALAYLEKAKTYVVTPAGVNYYKFLDHMAYNYTNTGDVNFQDLYMQGHPAKATISVIQFTDGWGEDEDIDHDFAAWAKANAKTFMTVSYENNGGANGGPTDFSIQKMVAQGHPNIYNERVTQIDNAAIVKQFEETGVETTQVNARATINVAPEEGLKLKTVNLVKADGTKEELPVVDNKVNVDKELEDGKWTVEVTAEGVVPEDRKVVTTVTSNGVELGRNEIIFNGCVDDEKGRGATLSFVDLEGNELKTKETLIAEGQKLDTEFSGKVETELRVGDRLYRLVKVSLGDSNIEGTEVVGKVTKDEQNYVAYYAEVKAAPVKVKFVDANGKELKGEVNLLTAESKLGGDFKFDVSKKLTVDKKEYELVNVTLKGSEVKEIKGKFGEEELVYTVKYKEIVKPVAPIAKLPKTSAIK